MTIHQCPKCELRFAWKTEVDDHCWHDHPEFRHEYPAVAVRPAPADAEAVPAKPAVVQHSHLGASSLAAWLQPTRRRERRAVPDPQPPPR
jgi:hypothetical protein